MTPHSPLLPLVLLLALPASLSANPNDWPTWRGTDHTGHTNPDQDLPLKFSKSENVRWVATIPGKGHGSPIVVGEQIFLATADEKAKTQSLLCYNRKTGKQVWAKEIHKGNFPKKINNKATHASSTPACDGERVFINFMNDGAVHTTALNLKGKILWQTEVTKYVVHQGFGSSPAVYKNLLIVSADNKTGGAICGLDRKTGKIIWKTERPKKPNYVSPVIYKIGGRDQLILMGCDLVTSLDPNDGKKLWEFKGATTECVSSIVTDGTHVFTSGGYPKNHISAVKADGSGEVVWKNISRVYVPSMLVKDGYLYAVMDAGIAMCWKSATGEKMWKSKLGGAFSASPVLVGDDIHAINENGQHFVFKANPREFKLIAKNQLGEQAFATPTICGGHIYCRVVEDENDQRVEKLYCLGKK